MVKVNELRIRKDTKKFRSHGNPICQTCETETTEIGRVGTGRFCACRKCEPSLFAELERMGLIPMDGYDTTVQCGKCGRKQHLNFANGLKNGWSKCCGKTMPIVACIANIDEAVKKIFPPLSLKVMRKQ